MALTPPEHFLGNRHLENIARKLAPGLHDVDSGGSLEDLDNGLVACDFQHLSRAPLTVWKRDLDDLSKRWSLDIF